MRKFDDNYTGIGYAVVYNYKSKLNGLNFDMTRLIDIELNLNDAVTLIGSRVSTYKEKLEDYYISVYDYKTEIPEKIREIKMGR